MSSSQVHIKKMGGAQLVQINGRGSAGPNMWEGLSLSKGQVDEGLSWPKQMRGAQLA